MPDQKVNLTVPPKTETPAIPDLDITTTAATAGAFRKRRTIAIGAATLVLLTVTVHDLPAQAVTMKEEAYAAASQTHGGGGGRPSRPSPPGTTST